MTEPSIDLEGRRILVIEDSPVVASFVTSVLTDLGCTVIGPAPNMAVARELVESGEFDAALIDVYIRGERAFPLCDKLGERRLPFVLTSGYADWQVPEKWADWPRLQKPYLLEGVRDALKAALAR
ncbi:response regulator [Sphingomonas sp.]|uniref:response regulator n=1 Tax=Sphingomonas sp. TaxID=28214 RepID=UPI0025F9291F|nr:response regulator [Sphingomonas sp.]MBV9529187.1 response regulator [Sphingomonas sp.]